MTALRSTSALDPIKPFRLRRMAVLRVLVHPRAAARLLNDLAAESEMRRYAGGVLINACVAAHYKPRER